MSAQQWPAATDSEEILGNYNAERQQQPCYKNYAKD